MYHDIYFWYIWYEQLFMWPLDGVYVYFDLFYYVLMYEFWMYMYVWMYYALSWDEMLWFIMHMWM